ncbi:MAG: VOC family protein [Actinomycetota bacterium]
MATNPGTWIVTKIIFPVADMGVAVDFYRRLGFEVEQYDSGYAWVRHRGEELLHLALAPALNPEDNAAAGYLHVQDVADWHAAWSATDADAEVGVVVGPLLDQPWGMREFSLRDPSGNLLRIGQNL